ncbi:MAG: DUF3391 domain-containing protein [Candidatus Marinimicrobia bacterium]|nr:DUF3391 domain-containing protein [Candidatus Neomarinimicrobiota bacterium]
MIKEVKSVDLKVGMYVMLGKSWLHHSFLKPNFKISSEKQIKKIISDGLKVVQVDSSKSDVPEERNLMVDLLGPGANGATHTEIDVPEKFNPIDLISEELHKTIQNTNIPPKTKARAVYNYSIKMMDNILNEPSAENILSGKTMVYDIVDHILTDDETAKAMAQITSHDYYTYTHSVNVGMLSVLLAKSIFKDTRDHNMQELGAGFFLHDLGKCDVPLELINKAGKLSEQEWRVMRDHPQIGNRILSDTNQLTKECGVIVMQHHEREDGTGYPFNLDRDRIHVYARICSIADVYDALTSTRAYKVKLDPFDALKIMHDEMLHHFNKELFREFVLLFKN